MPKISIQVASTSQTTNIFIQNSGSTTGAGLTGLVFNTSGLTAYYVLPRAASVAITLATLAATTSAYSSGGFKEIDATNMPGWYRFDIPDAALASGRSVGVHFQGAAGMAPLPLEIELTGWNNQDAVHGGFTCLPNTAVTTNASLLTSGTGTDQLSVTSGRIDAGKWLGGTIPAVTVTGVPLVDLKYTLGTISPATAGSVRADAVTGAVGSVTAGVTLASGQLFVKKNTQITVTFPMTDSTTHLPKTGVTVTAQRSIDGAAIASCANSAAELSLGLYSLVLAAADVNGAMITLVLSGSGCDTRFIGLVTQP